MKKHIFLSKRHLIVSMMLAFILSFFSCEEPTTPVTSITLTSESLSLTEGESFKLTASVNPSNATDKTLVWSSSDTTVASVTDGLVTAIKGGTATISVLSNDGGAKAKCTVIVSKKIIEVQSITLSSKYEDMIVGDTLRLTATINPDDASNKTVFWRSSDATIAKVTEGLIYAMKEGSATIKAFGGNNFVSDSCMVSISPKYIEVESVILSQSEANMYVGETLTLFASIMPDNATDTTITWSSSDEAIATVDENGNVLAVAKGTATIIAKAGDFTAECSLFVKAPPVSGVRIIPSEIDIEIGKQAVLSYQVEPEGAEIVGKVHWWTNNGRVATVSQDGLVNALFKGQVTINVQIDNVVASCTVNCVLSPEALRDRDALIALYNSTNGPAWKNVWNDWDVRKNWCSDEDLSTWQGVDCENGRVIRINLSGSNLVGSLPEEMENLTELRELFLHENLLEGPIPAFVSKLENLEKLVLTGNNFSGEIPSFLGSLSHLKSLWLHDNYLTGSIPSCFINLKELEDLRLCDNYLSGKIPDEFYDWDFWKSWWGMSIKDNLYKFEDLKLPGPKFNVTTYDNHYLNSEQIYSSHQYTILLQWDPIEYGCIVDLCDEFRFLKAKYGDSIKIITWTRTNSNSSKGAESLDCWKKMNISGEFFFWDSANHINTFGTVPYYPSNYVTTLTVVDNTGRIVLSDVFDRDYNLTEWFAGKSIPVNPGDRYVSIDYSRDGAITCLQKGKMKSGPNLVFIGDGYSDRLLDKYDTDVNRACDAFFSEEPYTSYRDYFNVYKITTVSPNEVFEDGCKTVLSCKYRGGTLITGDDKKCMSYALNAVKDGASMDKTVIIVLVNCDKYAGTSDMYGLWYGDWGNGLSIAYCSTVKDNATFRGIISHEAGGHGFAKLADEYSGNSIAIPQVSVDDLNSKSIQGWGKNIDFTNDTNMVKWREFIQDKRYINEKIGCYEGGFNYMKGVWRPTENSIMRYNTGGFNAPSRYAIWYRIIKEVYGATAEATYEQFVEFDKKDSITANRQQANTWQSSNARQMPPLAPPIIHYHSWKEEYYK